MSVLVPVCNCITSAESDIQQYFFSLSHFLVLFRQIEKILPFYTIWFPKRSVPTNFMFTCLSKRIISACIYFFHLQLDMYAIIGPNMWHVCHYWVLIGPNMCMLMCMLYNLQCRYHSFWHTICTSCHWCLFWLKIAKCCI